MSHLSYDPTDGYLAYLDSAGHWHVHDQTGQEVYYSSWSVLVCSMCRQPGRHVHACE